MKYILLLSLFAYQAAIAQQKESTVSVSCYVNPELYIQANVIAQVSDQNGNISCKGRYISVRNKNVKPFYYKLGDRWIAVKPQGSAIVVPGGKSGSSTTQVPSILKLSVRYTPSTSGGLSARIGAISDMNAKTDQIKARELEGSKNAGKSASKPPAEAVAKVNRPQPVEAPPAPKPNPPATSAPKAAIKSTATTKVAIKPTKKKVVVKAKPKRQTGPARSEPASQNARKTTTVSRAPSNAIGLRVDFGEGAAGLGPNLRHNFNRNLSLDAAIVFFEGGGLGLGAQVERNFPARGASGLNYYIGIGPQILIGEENTALALVSVTGIDYKMPGSPVNLSFDWRPNFYLSPEAAVQAGRFGLSLRVAL